MKKRLFITLLVSVIVFSFAYIIFTNYLDVLTVSKGSREVITGADLGEGNEIKQVKDYEILFLLTGVDHNGEDQDKEKDRTDTLMLVKVDTKDGTVDLISIPRDSMVPIEGYGKDKINHAHHFGGMALTMRTIRNYFGIDLDYYVKVSFEAVREIVDAMGGVKVNVPVQIIENQTGIYLEPGEQVLNGKEALYFARYRESYGDFGRMESQQHLMKRIMEQMLKPENISKIPGFIKTYMTRVETNIPMSTMLSLAASASKFSTDRMTNTTFPGEGEYIDGISYVILDKDGVDTIIKDKLSDYLLDGNEGEEETINEGE